MYVTVRDRDPRCSCAPTGRKGSLSPMFEGGHAAETVSMALPPHPEGTPGASSGFLFREFLRVSLPN